MLRLSLSKYGCAHCSVHSLTTAGELFWQLTTRMPMVGGADAFTVISARVSMLAVCCILGILELSWEPALVC